MICFNHGIRVLSRWRNSRIVSCNRFSLVWLFQYWKSLGCPTFDYYEFSPDGSNINKSSFTFFIILRNWNFVGCTASWYVQNVSTFPNTFAVVSPLIYVFWIQLTQTNAIFSRIALVSHFCAKIQLLGKILENTAKILFYQKTHGARVRDGEGPGGHHTTWWRGPGLAAPGVVWSPQPSPRAPLPPTYTLWPETIGGSAFFPARVPLRHHHQKLRFRTKNSALALCRDGDLEEIFIIIITDVSPSTIHDSPIHVWVILAVGEEDGRDWMRLFM
jgi:hypothetical protein